MRWPSRSSSGARPRSTSSAAGTRNCWERIGFATTAGTHTLQSAELLNRGASTYEPAQQGQRLTLVDDLVGQQLRLLDATARRISPFAGSDAAIDHSVEEVAAALSRSERWVRNNLRRSRIEQPNDEATRIVRAEALRLFDICQAEVAAKERDATPKSLPRPSRPRREPAPLDRTQVRAAANDLGTGDHAAIAQRLEVDLGTLQRLVTADPMLRYQLEQIDKKLGRSA